MGYDVALEGIYASVVKDLRFDPEVMLRGAPTADELIERSYQQVRAGDNVAPEPESTEPPQAFDGFKFSEEGKIHGYHEIKSMSRCGKRFNGEELVATVTVGVTPDEDLCRICWHDHFAAPEVKGELVVEAPMIVSEPEVLEGEVISETETWESEKPCPECGAVGGPYPNHERPAGGSLQSGCPTCGWCY
jgi:hypothetical protein